MWANFVSLFLHCLVLGSSERRNRRKLAENANAPGISVPGEIVAGSGVPGFSSWDLLYPSDVRVDEEDNIFVVDSGNHRLMKFQLGRGGSSLASPIEDPASLFLAGNSSFFVSEPTRHRVSRWAEDVGWMGMEGKGGGGVNNTLNRSTVMENILSSAFAWSLSTSRTLVADMRSHKVMIWEKGRPFPVNTTQHLDLLRVNDSWLEFYNETLPPSAQWTNKNFSNSTNTSFPVRCGWADFGRFKGWGSHFQKYFPKNDSYQEIEFDTLEEAVNRCESLGSICLGISQIGCKPGECDPKNISNFENATTWKNISDCWNETLPLNPVNCTFSRNMTTYQNCSRTFNLTDPLWPTNWTNCSHWMGDTTFWANFTVGNFSNSSAPSSEHSWTLWNISSLHFGERAPSKCSYSKNCTYYTNITHFWNCTISGGNSSCSPDLSIKSWESCEEWAPSEWVNRTWNELTNNSFSQLGGSGYGSQGGFNYSWFNHSRCNNFTEWWTFGNWTNYTEYSCLGYEGPVKFKLGICSNFSDCSWMPENASCFTRAFGKHCGNISEPSGHYFSGGHRRVPVMALHGTPSLDVNFRSKYEHLNPEFVQTLILGDLQSSRLEFWNASQQLISPHPALSLQGAYQNKGFFFPSAVTSDKNGSLYVASYDSHRVQKFPEHKMLEIFNNGTNHSKWTIAGGEGFGNGTWQLAFPSGLHADKLGQLFVSDTYNHRVMLYRNVYKYENYSMMVNYSSPHNLSCNGTELAYNFTSQICNYTRRWHEKDAHVLLGRWGNWGAQGWRDVRFPHGLTVDKRGYLLVADSGNHRIVRFPLAMNVSNKVCEMGKMCEIPIIPGLLTEKNSFLSIAHLNASCADLHPQDALNFTNASGVTIWENPKQIEHFGTTNIFRFGVATRAPVSNYFRLCWSQSEPLWTNFQYQVGRLELKGPTQGNFDCTLSLPCRLTIPGAGLSSDDQIMVILSDLQPNGSIHNMTVYNMSGPFHCGHPLAIPMSLSAASNPLFPSSSLSWDYNVYDLQRLKRGYPGRKYHICWGTRVGLDKNSINVLVGDLEVRGPYQGAHISCVFGLACNFTLPSEGVTNKTGGIAILPYHLECGNSQNFVQWTATAEGLSVSTPLEHDALYGPGKRYDHYTLGIPHGGAPAHDYKICWRDRPGEPYFVEAARLEMQGPFPVANTYCTVGYPCIVKLEGVGLSSNNTLKLLNASHPCHLTREALPITGVQNISFAGANLSLVPLDMLPFDWGIGAKGFNASIEEINDRQNDTFNLGVISAPTEGYRKMCWRNDLMDILEPGFTGYIEVGMFWWTRPWTTSNNCTVGLPCTLTVYGKNFEPSNEILILQNSTCGDVLHAVPMNLSQFRSPQQVTWLPDGNPGDSNHAYFHIGTSVERFGGAQYSVCWAHRPFWKNRTEEYRNVSSYLLGNFSVPVGDFHFHGPNTRNFECTMGMDCLLEVNGTGLAVSNRILIINSNSSCGDEFPLLPELGTRYLFEKNVGIKNIAWDNKGTIYAVGIATSGTPSTGLLLCWAHNPDYSSEYSDFNYEIGKFEMHGPLPTVSFCVVGQPCEIAVEGAGLNGRNRVMVIKSAYRCGDYVPSGDLLSTPGITLPANASQSDPGKFHLGTPTAYDLETYSACWAGDPDSFVNPSLTANYASLFSVELGRFYIVSVLPAPSNCTVGLPCSVDVRGIGFTSSNGVTLVRGTDYSSFACATAPHADNVPGLIVPANSSLPDEGFDTWRNFSLGYPTGRVNNQYYRLCWAFSPTSVKASEFTEEVGIWKLIGPNHMDFACTFGLPCNLLLSGESLAKFNQISLVLDVNGDGEVTQCGTNVAPPAEWRGMISVKNETNTSDHFLYSMGTPFGGHKANNSYFLCWGYYNTEMFSLFGLVRREWAGWTNVRVGRFAMQGPELRTFQILVNQSSEVQVSGHGLTAQDRILFIRGRALEKDNCKGAHFDQYLWSNQTKVAWVNNGTLLSSSQTNFQVQFWEPSEYAFMCWARSPSKKEDFITQVGPMLVWGPQIIPGKSGRNCTVYRPCEMELQGVISHESVVRIVEGWECNGKNVSDVALNVYREGTITRSFHAENTVVYSTVAFLHRTFFKHPAGAYSACWLNTTEDSHMFRWGTLHLKGPSPNQVFQIWVNESATLRMEGHGLEDVGRILITDDPLSDQCASLPESNSEYLEDAPDRPIVTAPSAPFDIGYSYAEFHGVRFPSEPGEYLVCWSDYNLTDPYDVPVGKVKVEGPRGGQTYFSNVQQSTDFIVEGFEINSTMSFWLDFGPSCRPFEDETFNADPLLRVKVPNVTLANVSIPLAGPNQTALPLTEGQGKLLSLNNLRLTQQGTWSACWIPPYRSSKYFKFGHVDIGGPFPERKVMSRTIDGYIRVEGNFLNDHNRIVVIQEGEECGSELSQSVLQSTPPGIREDSSNADVSDYLLGGFPSTGVYRVCWLHHYSDSPPLSSIQDFRYDIGLLHVGGPSLELSEIFRKVNQAEDLVLTGYFPWPLRDTMRVVISDQLCGTESTTMTHNLGFLGIPSGEATYKFDYNATWAAINFLREGHYFICWCGGWNGYQEDSTCDTTTGGEDFVIQAGTISVSVSPLGPPRILSATFVNNFAMIEVLFDAALGFRSCAQFLCECVFDDLTVDTFGDPTQRRCHLQGGDMKVVVMLGAGNTVTLPNLDTTKGFLVTKANQISRKESTISEYSPLESIPLQSEDAVPEVQVFLAAPSSFTACAELKISVVESLGSSGKGFSYNWEVECVDTSKSGPFCDAIATFFDGAGAHVEVSRGLLYSSFSTLSSSQQFRNHELVITATLTNFAGKVGSASHRMVLVGQNVILPEISRVSSEVQRVSKSYMTDVVANAQAGVSQDSCMSGSYAFGMTPLIDWKYSIISGSGEEALQIARRTEVVDDVSSWPDFVDLESNPGALKIPSNFHPYDSTIKYLAVAYTDPTLKQLNVELPFYVQVPPRARPVAVLAVPQTAKTSCAFSVSACSSFDPANYNLIQGLKFRFRCFREATGENCWSPESLLGSQFSEAFTSNCNIDIGAEQLAEGPYQFTLEVQSTYAGSGGKLFYSVSEKVMQNLLMELEGFPPLVVDPVPSRISPFNDLRVASRLVRKGGRCLADYVHSACLLLKYSAGSKSLYDGGPDVFPARADQVVKILPRESEVEVTNLALNEGSQVETCSCLTSDGCMDSLEPLASYIVAVVLSSLQDQVAHFLEKEDGIEAIISGNCIDSTGAVCTLVDLENSGILAYHSTPFVVDLVPQGGRVEVYPPVGEEFVTAFMVMTSGWTDEEPSQLLFRFTVTPVAEPGSVVSIGAAHILTASEWTQLASFSDLKLPNGFFWITVDVKDVLGSTATAEVWLQVNRVPTLVEQNLISVLEEVRSSTSSDIVLTTVQMTTRSSVSDSGLLTSMMLDTTYLSAQLMSMDSSGTEMTSKTINEVLSVKRSTTMTASDVNVASSIMAEVFNKAVVEGQALDMKALREGFTAVLQTSEVSVEVAVKTGLSNDIKAEAIVLDTQLRNTMKNLGRTMVNSLLTSGGNFLEVISNEGTSIVTSELIEIQTQLPGTQSGEPTVFKGGQMPPIVENRRGRALEEERNLQSSLGDISGCAYTDVQISRFHSNRYFSLYSPFLDQGIYESTPLLELFMTCGGSQSLNLPLTTVEGEPYEVEIMVPARRFPGKDRFLCTQFDLITRQFVQRGVRSGQCRPAATGIPGVEMECPCYVQQFGIFAISVYAAARGPVLNNSTTFYMEEWETAIKNTQQIPLLAVLALLILISIVAAGMGFAKEARPDLTEEDRFDLLIGTAPLNPKIRGLAARLNRMRLSLVGVLSGDKIRPFSLAEYQKTQGAGGGAVPELPPLVRGQNPDLFPQYPRLYYGGIHPFFEPYSRADSVPEYSTIFDLFKKIFKKNQFYCAWSEAHFRHSHRGKSLIFLLYLWLQVVFIWGWIEVASSGPQDSGLAQFLGTNIKCGDDPAPPPSTWDSRCLEERDALRDFEQLSWLDYSDSVRQTLITAALRPVTSETWNAGSPIYTFADGVNRGWSRFVPGEGLVEEGSNGFLMWFSRLQWAQRSALAQLGYGEDIFRSCISASSMNSTCSERYNYLHDRLASSNWYSLDEIERLAYQRLGYSDYSVWSGGELPMVWTDRVWLNLTQTEKISARTLGFSEDTWDQCGYKMPRDVNQGNLGSAENPYDPCGGVTPFTVGEGGLAIFLAIFAELFAIFICELLGGVFSRSYPVPGDDKSQVVERWMWRERWASLFALILCGLIFTVVFLRGFLGLGSGGVIDTASGTADALAQAHFFTAMVLALVWNFLRSAGYYLFLAIWWDTNWATEGSFGRGFAFLFPSSLDALTYPLISLQLYRREEKRRAATFQADAEGALEERRELELEVEKTLQGHDMKHPEYGRMKPPLYNLTADNSLEDYQKRLPVLPPPLRASPVLSSTVGRALSPGMGFSANIERIDFAEVSPTSRKAKQGPAWGASKSGHREEASPPRPKKVDISAQGSKYKVNEEKFEQLREKEFRKPQVIKAPTEPVKPPPPSLPHLPPELPGLPPEVQKQIDDEEERLDVVDV